MTVMLLGGLWHGASWNFVIWGGIHGLMLAAERCWGGEGQRLARPARVALTFLIVCLAWVFFRAETLPQAVSYLASMFGLAEPQPQAACVAAMIYTRYHLVVFLVCALVVWGGTQGWTFTQRLSPVRAGVCLALLVLDLVFLWTQTVNPFLYFQF
jgi:alginate O-acetyltransferase complex protein AlgI